MNEVTLIGSEAIDVVRDCGMSLCTTYQQNNHEPPPSKYTEKFTAWQGKSSPKSLKYHKKQDFRTFVFQDENPYIYTPHLESFT
jgi:hypothetical protein